MIRPRNHDLALLGRVGICQGFNCSIRARCGEYTDGWSDDGSFTSDPGDIETHQYVWGTNYIDELIYYQRDLNHNKNFNDDSSGKHYIIRDRNYSVIGVATGSTIERVRYTPYGESQVQIAADVTGEGVIDVDDFNAILSAIGGTIDGSVAGYTVEADINRDGVVDIDDLNIYFSAPTGSVPENTVGYGTGNIIGYAGYVFEEELGMYLVRHRWYTPNNGRWNTRDWIDALPAEQLFTARAAEFEFAAGASRPSAYVGLLAPWRQVADGMNLYEYGKSNAISTIDPNGTACFVFLKCTLTSSVYRNRTWPLKNIRTCNYNCVEGHQNPGAPTRRQSGHDILNCDDIPDPHTSGWFLQQEKEYSEFVGCRQCEQTYYVEKLYKEHFPFGDCSRAQCKTTCKNAGGAKHLCHLLEPPFKQMCQLAISTGAMNCKEICDAFCKRR